MAAMCMVLRLLLVVRLWTLLRYGEVRRNASRARPAPALAPSPPAFLNRILTSFSSVPSAKDVLVPETLLKKRKADSKLREENQAKALELRKVSLTTP